MTITVYTCHHTVLNDKVDRLVYENLLSWDFCSVRECVRACFCIWTICSSLTREKWHKSKDYKEKRSCVIQQNNCLLLSKRKQMKFITVINFISKRVNLAHLFCVCLDKWVTDKL